MPKHAQAGAKCHPANYGHNTCVLSEDAEKPSSFNCRGPEEDRCILENRGQKITLKFQPHAEGTPTPGHPLFNFKPEQVQELLEPLGYKSNCEKQKNEHPQNYYAPGVPK